MSTSPTFQQQAQAAYEDVLLSAEKLLGAQQSALTLLKAELEIERSFHTRRLEALSARVDLACRAVVAPQGPSPHAPQECERAITHLCRDIDYYPSRSGKSMEEVSDGQKALWLSSLENWILDMGTEQIAQKTFSQEMLEHFSKVGGLLPHQVQFLNNFPLSEKVLGVYLRLRDSSPSYDPELRQLALVHKLRIPRASLYALATHFLQQERAPLIATVKEECTRKEECWLTELVQGHPESFLAQHPEERERYRISLFSPVDEIKKKLPPFLYPWAHGGPPNTPPLYYQLGAVPTGYRGDERHVPNWALHLASCLNLGHFSMQHHLVSKESCFYRTYYKWDDHYVSISQAFCKGPTPPSIPRKWAHSFECWYHDVRVSEQVYENCCKAGWDEFWKAVPDYGHIASSYSGNAGTIPQMQAVQKCAEQKFCEGRKEVERALEQNSAFQEQKKPLQWQLRSIEQLALVLGVPSEWIAPLKKQITLNTEDLTQPLLPTSIPSMPSCTVSSPLVEDLCPTQ